MMLALAGLILQSIGTAEVATLDSIRSRSGRLAEAGDVVVLFGVRGAVRSMPGQTGVLEPTGA
jgi:hypothetical protein